MNVEAAEIKISRCIGYLTFDSAQNNGSFNLLLRGGDVGEVSSSQIMLDKNHFVWQMEPQTPKLLAHQALGIHFTQILRTYLQVCKVVNQGIAVNS